MCESLPTDGFVISDDCDCAKCTTDLNTQSEFPLEHSFFYSMPYSCTQCHKGFIDENDLRRHIVSSGRHSKALYFCSKCNINFKTKIEYEAHIISLLEKNGKHTSNRSKPIFPFTCMECFSGFASEDELIVHSYNHLRCINCSGKFHKIPDLFYHYTTKHNLPSNCKNNNFLQKLAVKFDLENQPKDKNFECHNCKGKFASVGAMIKHSCGISRTRKVYVYIKKKKSNMSSNKGLVFKCPICKGQFLGINSLKWHLQQKHSSLNSNSITTNFNNNSVLKANANSRAASGAEPTKKLMDCKSTGCNMLALPIKVKDNDKMPSAITNFKINDKSNLDSPIKIKKIVAPFVASTEQSIDCRKCGKTLAQWE